MWNRAVSWLCALLAACAEAPVVTQPPQQLFNDQLFAAPSEPIGADEVFALSDEMRRYLKVDIAHQLRTEGRQRGLIDALSTRSQLKLEYDSAMTRNAAQAFAARSGNCLSLVIMTAALAKELELPVYYQSVEVDEAWSRSGNLHFSSGHVNLTLGKRTTDSASGLDPKRLLTIDFLPAEDILGQRTRSISEATVVAMYMNNRAFEALVRGRVDDAYWWARGAVRQAPGFMNAYNTLGVVYLRHGNHREAEQVLGYVLEREPRSTLALANMANALDAQQRTAEASVLRERLLRIEPDPPFHFFDQGMAAMREGDFNAARELFAKEVRRAPYNHEFHFWLGVADFKLGRLDDARRQLTLAIETSSTRGEQDLYAAKLAWLKAHRAQ